MKDNEKIATTCWIKSLVPEQSQKFFDTMAFMIIGFDKETYTVIPVASPGEVYKIKKSEVVFQDRITETIPKEYRIK